MPAVSIVIPIYNAEPFLRQCLDSIQMQTLQDIEVLCVNDGSPDNSLSILQEYAAADTRFKVLDKPNGGYGHSLNYGLGRAQGEYVAIVEPDDFLDENMYSDLLSFASFEDGKKADIVKGSYVEYFDGREGLDEQLRSPSLPNCMPRIPFAFTLEQHSEVFCHHPSIWSAIYRREFLEQNDIHFIEPKGAGWADNPFLAETLVKAQKIVWVPRPYYFYRQTNPGSSSFLKDFNLPFDRARDMRAILHENNVGPDIWAAFYLREFDYIHSVCGEFGFTEDNPVIQSLIKEVLDDMDEGIVLTNKRLRPYDAKYYSEFMSQYELGGEETVPGASSEDNASPAADSYSPKLSFVLPICEDAPWLDTCIQSILRQPLSDIEIICTECESSDRSIAACEHYGKDDKRFVVLKGNSGIPAGINAALQAVRGEYCFVLNPSNCIADEFFSEAVERAIELNLDMALFDSESRYVVDAVRLAGKVLMSKSREADFSKHEFMMAAPFDASAACDFAPLAVRPYAHSALYKTSFLQQSGIKFAEREEWGSAVFNMKLLQKSGQVGYVAGLCLEDLDRMVASAPFALSMREDVSFEKPLVVPSLVSYVASEECSYSNKVFANMTLEAFTWDMKQRRSYEGLREYCEEWLPAVREIVSKCPGREFYYFEAYSEFQLLIARGFEAYISDRYLKCDAAAHFLSEELDALRQSPTVKAGIKMSKFVRRVLPDKAVGKAKKMLSR